jgi:exosome complex component RRP46
LLVAESEGSFTLEDWDEVYQIGKALCCGGVETSDDYAMQADGLGETGYMRFIRSTLDEKVSNDLYWKD